MSLYEELTQGPVVLTFYRGGWCPFCSMQLRAYQGIMPDIQAIGAQLIAVSPQSPDNTLSQQEKESLTYQVLSDTEGLAAAQYNILYDVPSYIQEVMQNRFGLNLAEYNASDRWVLPVPATFMIDERAVIRSSYVNPDYMKRLEPQGIPKHTIVQTPDTVREGLFFLKEGKLRLYKLNKEGKQFTVAILKKGNMFGELESFSLGTSRVFIETMEDSFLCTMSERQFEWLMTRHPKLALKFLKSLSDRLNEQDEILEQLAFNDLRGRILHLLSMLSAKFGVDEGEYVRIDLPLSHQEIAKMLGVTREAVSVIMRKLVQEKVIKTGRISVRLAAERYPNVQSKNGTDWA
nr:redoxin domain-containing protein [Paenibacillus sabinae]